MVAAVAVGDGVAAVFQHDPHACDSCSLGGIDAAAPVDDAAKDGHAAADRLAANPYGGVGDVASDAARIDSFGPVERLAFACVAADFQRVADLGRATGCKRRNGKGEASAASGNLRARLLTVQPDAVRPQSHSGGEDVGELGRCGGAGGVAVAG
jgi:hypothetical protein